MKKGLNIITTLFVVLLLTGCTFTAVKNKDSNTKVEIEKSLKVAYNLESESEIEIIDILTVFNKIKREKGILIISSPDCKFCIEAMPIINKIKNENKNVKVYYVNPSSINQENRKLLDKLVGENLKKDVNGKILLRVPDVYAFENNKILANQRGGSNDINELNDKYNELFNLVK